MCRNLATYKQIQEYIKKNFEYTPKTCWIGHMKEVCGLHPIIIANRHSLESKVHSCP